MNIGGAVYIMSSPNRGTIYVGITSNLQNRITQHRNKQDPESYTARYNCVMLVYYRSFPNIEEAIAEEKRLKAGSRKGKERLIDNFNPKWDDLYETLFS